MDTTHTVNGKAKPAVNGRVWIAIGVLAALGLTLLLIPRSVNGSSSPSKPALLGTILQGGRMAPSFRLHDQFGHSVSLASLRGRTVVLTFMEAHCNQMCPRLADKMHQMADEVDPTGRKIAILAMTTDPEGDTPEAARAFSRRHGLLARWHYLVGTRKELTPLWHAYAIYAAPKASSPTLDAAHTSATYLIDKKGRERVLMGGDLDVSALEWDVRMLAGLPLGAPTHLDPAPEVGHPAPDFTLRTPGGGTISLHALRGKVVLLNFWATWCHPCRSEMPELSAWYRQQHAKGLVVLGVDQQEGAHAAAEYAQRIHASYPLALDSDGSVSSRYDVVGLPTSFLIDRNGVVRSAPPPGVVKAAYLAQHVLPFLAQAATK
jgi:peroxiredoxin